MAIWLTRRVLDDANLPPLEKAVLFVMAFTAGNEDGSNCFPRINTLARQTGYTRRAVLAGLKRLQLRGYLAKVREARSHSPAEWRVEVNVVHPSEVNVVHLRGERGAPLIKEISKTGDLKQPDPSDLKATVILEDSDHGTYAFHKNSSPSEPSSTTGEVSTSGRRKDLTVLARFKARQAQIGVETLTERRRRRAGA